MICSGKDGREGALTAIGAVSPPGGDISEPVSQATLRIVKVFWGLDANLAYKRHFPAINWLTSYSLYLDSVGGWFDENVANDWMKLRQRMMTLLQEEAELEEIEELSEEDMKTVGELINRVEEIVPELHREERKFDVSRLLDALSMGNGMER